MEVADKKTLNECFPDNGKFTQVDRTMCTIQDGTSPCTVRNHADTIMMSKIQKNISIGHTDNTRGDSDHMLMSEPSTQPPPHVQHRNDYVLRFHAEMKYKRKIVIHERVGEADGEGNVEKKTKCAAQPLPLFIPRQVMLTMMTRRGFVRKPTGTQPNQ